MKKFMTSQLGFKINEPRKTTNSPERSLRTLFQVRPRKQPKKPPQQRVELGQFSNPRTRNSSQKRNIPPKSTSQSKLQPIIQPTISSSVSMNSRQSNNLNKKKAEQMKRYKQKSKELLNGLLSASQSNSVAQSKSRNSPTSRSKSQPRNSPTSRSKSQSRNSPSKLTPQSELKVQSRSRNLSPPQLQSNSTNLTPQSTPQLQSKLTPRAPGLHNINKGRRFKPKDKDKGSLRRDELLQTLIKRYSNHNGIINSKINTLIQNREQKINELLKLTSQLKEIHTDPSNINILTDIDENILKLTAKQSNLGNNINKIDRDIANLGNTKLEKLNKQKLEATKILKSLEKASDEKILQSYIDIRNDIEKIFKAQDEITRNKNKNNNHIQSKKHLRQQILNARSKAEKHLKNYQTGEYLGKIFLNSQKRQKRLNSIIGKMKIST